MTKPEIKLKAAEILREAAALLDRKRWVQNSLAVDENDSAVSSNSQDADGYCLLGAVARVSNLSEDNIYTADELASLSTSTCECSYCWKCLTRKHLQKTKKKLPPEEVVEAVASLQKVTRTSSVPDFNDNSSTTGKLARNALVRAARRLEGGRK